MMQKQSPPMPVIAGSTTPSSATAVTAASAAVPPARNVSIAACVASGWEVAAMASLAMTGERPGKWKSRITWSRRCAVLLRRPSMGVRVIRCDLAFAARYPQPDEQAGNEIDEADNGEDRECGIGGLLHQQKLGSSAAEHEKREHVIHRRFRAGRLHDFDEQQKQRTGDERVAERRGPVEAGEQAHRVKLRRPAVRQRRQEGDHVVDRQRNNQKGKADEGHGEPLRPMVGVAAETAAGQTSALGLSTCRPRYMPVFRSM